MKAWSALARRQKDAWGWKCSGLETQPELRAEGDGENPRRGGGGEDGGNKGRQTPRRTAGGRQADRATDSFPSASF